MNDRIESNLRIVADSPAITADTILADPSASFWIKSALRTALDRDPVDAANDADVLAAVLAARAGPC